MGRGKVGKGKARSACMAQAGILPKVSWWRDKLGSGRHMGRQVKLAGVGQGPLGKVWGGGRAGRRGKAGVLATSNTPHTHATKEGTGITTQGG